MAPLGIVPNLNGGLIDIGFDSRWSSSPDRFGNIMAILGYVLTRSSFPASLWPVQICKASL